MPITSEGYELKRFVDIVSEINQEQITNLAADLNTSPDTVLGVLTNIFANAISSQEELNQAVSDNFNIDKAEGKYLDDLVALVGIERLAESPTTGTLEVTATDNTVIPLGTNFSGGGHTVTTLTEEVVTQGNCTKCVITLDLVVEGVNYIIKVGDISYSYVSGSEDTTEDVLTNLNTSLSSNPNILSTFDTPLQTLTIETSQPLNPVSLLVGSRFTIQEVTTAIRVSNIVVGAIEILPGVITAIDSLIPTVTLVNNPFKFVTGRVLETDEQLRGRQRESTRVAGTATLPAIRAALLQTEGVEGADILENTTIETDSRGLPPKSYEAVVVGGATPDILATLFNTKPAGVETYGDISGIVEYEGRDYRVSFSRPVDVTAWVDVTYTLYDEEAFPVGGEDTIKASILEYGNSFSVGVDIIPKRFYKNIYDNVSGINNLTVSVGISESPSEETDFYTEQLTPISEKGVASFDLSRIKVQRV